MVKDKQEQNHFKDDEGWIIDPHDPSQEIKVEVLENGDTLYGNRARENRNERTSKR